MNNQFNLQLHQEPIPYSNDRSREKVLANNKAMAAVYGDPRSHMKNLDRPGISRSEGHLAEASVRAANAFANQYADAVTRDQEARQAAGQVDLGSALDMERFAQAGTGVAQNDRYADLMSQLSRQQMAQGFMGNVLSGLMGGMGILG